MNQKQVEDPHAEERHPSDIMNPSRGLKQQLAGVIGGFRSIAERVKQVRDMNLSAKGTFTTESRGNAPKLGGLKLGMDQEWYAHSTAPMGTLCPPASIAWMRVHRQQTEPSRRLDFVVGAMPGASRHSPGMGKDQQRLTIERFSVRSAGRNQLAYAESVVFEPGRLHVLIGPNGSGKTSLLRGMAGVLPNSGSFLVGDSELANTTNVIRSEVIAYQPQTAPQADGLSASEFVLASGAARSGWLGGQTEEERVRGEIALRAAGAESLAGRMLNSLSGGELARVMLAGTLAMGRGWLFLDEPVAAADVSAARALYTLLRGLVAGGAASVVVVEHDLGLARTFADDVSLMHNGELVLTAPVEQAFSSHLLETAYGCRFTSYQATPGAWAVVPADPLPKVQPMDLSPPLSTKPATNQSDQPEGFGLPGVPAAGG